MCTFKINLCQLTWYTSTLLSCVHCACPFAISISLVFLFCYCNVPFDLGQLSSLLLWSSVTFLERDTYFDVTDKHLDIPPFVGPWVLCLVSPFYSIYNNIYPQVTCCCFSREREFVCHITHHGF